MSYNITMEATQTGRTTPSRLPAWCFALCSIALVFGGAIFIFHVSNEIQAVRTFNALAKNISIGNYNASAANVEALLREGRLLALLKDSENSRVLGLSEFMQTTRELHNIVVLLRQGQYENALRNFNVLLDGRLQALLFASSPETARRIRDLQTSFKAYQQRIHTLAAEQENVPRQMEANLSSLKQLNLVAKSLAIDFGNLFGLPPVLRERNNNLMIEFYQAGVLQGLPILKDLPDGLADLAELKKALLEVDGEVRLRGANAHERFQRELARFQKESGDLQTATAKVFSDNAALQEQLRLLATKLFNESNGLEQQVSGLLFQVLKPDTSPETLFISRLLKLSLD